MRLFQNVGMYPSYLRHLNILAKSTNAFKDRMDVFLSDGYGACHILLPVMQGEKSTFFTNGDDQILQSYWAAEHGMSTKSSMEDILLAQIEQHTTEIFYNLDPLRYGNDFLKKLPGCVKKKIAWRAAPSANFDLGGYDLLVCNFPSILEGYKKNGWRARYFSPAHDPKMDSFAINQDRDIDILFVGGYSQYHQLRTKMLESVASMSDRFNVVMHLDCSRLTRLSESWIGKILPLKKHRRIDRIINLARPPVFGLDLYSTISRSKIVLNGAVDMAGFDRGNMRCFETLGCGAMLLSDEGLYPKGMVDNQTIRTYKSVNSVIPIIEETLLNSSWKDIAQNGYNLIRYSYSKSSQWAEFQNVIN